jgi:hypothetical protein
MYFSVSANFPGDVEPLGKYIFPGDVEPSGKYIFPGGV